MKIGIYKVTNLVNGKAYIGQAVNIEKRWQKHQSSSFKTNKNDYNVVFHKAIRKYGIENFKFEILEECQKEKLDERERYWIQYYHTWLGDPECKGYNITDGGKQGRKAEPEYLDEVYQMLREGYTYKEIGAKFNLTSQYISSINLGNSWRREDIEYPIKEVAKLKNNHCIDCGVLINSNSCRCVTCTAKIRGALIKHLDPSEYKIPSKVELLKELHELKYESKVALKYNVSSHLVHKWCEDLGIEVQNKKEMEYQYRREVLGEEITKPLKRNWNKKVVQLNPTTLSAIKEFNCIYDAAEEMGVNHECIRRAIVTGKKAVGYNWSYKQLGV